MRLYESNWWKVSAMNYVLSKFNLGFLHCEILFVFTHQLLDNLKCKLKWTLNYWTIRKMSIFGKKNIKSLFDGQL